MAKPVVLVVGGDDLIERTFKNRGFRPLTSVKTAQDIYQLDLVCFTGGADIDPKFYGEKPLARTYTNPPRDEYEKKMFDILSSYNLPMVGICRGAQLLNSLSGGKLWQHVDKHSGSHKAVDIITGFEVDVTSTHHQMMRPSKEAEIICLAHLSTERHSENYIDKSPNHDDIEVLYYEKTKSLCFQGHPEYNLPQCTQYFFDLVRDKFRLNGEIG